MKPYSIQQLAQAMGGRLLQGAGDFLVLGGVSTDTRKMSAGALFFALRGENYDAHQFLSQAVEAGAGALVVEVEAELPPGVPVIGVADSLVALQDLAAWYRGELAIRAVAISGSNGKTSTKDFVRNVLGQRYRVNATLGNLNNHIGLPLTVLATDEEHEVGVFEMGMNHAGELAPLCEIAQPEISIITNVGTAHIENLGSRDAIAHEKGTLARCLGKEGTVLVPADCDYLETFRDSTQARVVAVGNELARAEKIEPFGEGTKFELHLDGQGAISTAISVAGRHMLSNALLAAAAGALLGLSLEEIASGLESATLTSGRLRQYLSGGVQVVDDTYNANPESIAAALHTLAELPSEGQKTAVLGIMAELGDHAGPAYIRLGQLARELGLGLVTVGAEARGYAANIHFDQADEAITWMKQNLTAGGVVLFKGSRLAAMETMMRNTFPE